MVAKSLPLQLKLAEQVRVAYVIADLDPALPRADLLKPAMWTHLVPRLHVGDRIECMPRDASWYARPAGARDQRRRDGG